MEERVLKIISKPLTFDLLQDGLDIILEIGILSEQDRLAVLLDSSEVSCRIDATMIQDTGSECGRIVDNMSGGRINQERIRLGLPDYRSIPWLIS